MAIAWDECSGPVLRATGFSKCHRHHVLVRVEVANDQTCLRLSELLPDPGYAVNAWGLEPGDVGGVPDADGSLVICRVPSRTVKCTPSLCLRSLGHSSRCGMP